MGNRILRFLFGILMLVVFITGLILVAKKYRGYQEIKAMGVESDALFYTESPKALSAPSYISLKPGWKNRDTLKVIK